MKIEDAVQLLNREYMQSFCISKEHRAFGLQKIVDYLKDYCVKNPSCLYMAAEREKAYTNATLNCFAVSLTDSFSMTCIIQDLAAATAIRRRMWMPHLCT